MKKQKWIIAILLILCSVFLIIIWLKFQENLEQGELVEQGKLYKKHYLMIEDDKDALFWQAIYENAMQEAEKYDAYIEYIELQNNPKYSIKDCMKIAISSQVDGVILRPDGSQEMTDLINEAEENGIPVITIMDDAPESARLSYIGINSYHLADAYTEQVLPLLKEDETRILLLSNAGMADSRVQVIYSQLMNRIELEKRSDQTVLIKSFSPEGTKEFNSEEMIRDLILDSAQRPDVIICAEEIMTDCAYQALIDYSLVGSIDIIGFYYSDYILDAVQKGNIIATIAINADEFGKYAVDALEEYHSLGNTNAYYSVGLNIITKENASSFMETEGGLE